MFGTNLPIEFENGIGNCNHNELGEMRRFGIRVFFQRKGWILGCDRERCERI
jgi:hypothetical protein